MIRTRPPVENLGDMETGLRNKLRENGQGGLIRYSILTIANRRNVTEFVGQGIPVKKERTKDRIPL